MEENLLHRAAIVALAWMKLRANRSLNPNREGARLPSSSTLEALSEYLRDAWQANRSAYQSPGRGQPFRTPMFIFVRRAKAHSELETLGGLEVAELVEKCLKSWSSRGGEPWREWFPESDDGKTEFVDTWERIKWPRAALDDAKVSAARLPLKPFRCYSVKYGLFVSVAGYLQRSVNGPILLPCRKMATLLECDAMTVSRYRRLAVQDGLLRLTARGIKASIVVISASKRARSGRRGKL